MSLLDKPRPPFPPPSLRPTDRMPEPNDRIRIRPSRPHTPGRPTVQTPAPHRPTHTGLGDEYRKRRTWEPCSVLPMKQEGECRGGRAQKEEDQLCSGSTHTPIYYTIPYQEKTTARTRPSGGVWSCLASYSIFCLLSGFGWIDLPWNSVS